MRNGIVLPLAALAVLLFLGAAYALRGNLLPRTAGPGAAESSVPTPSPKPSPTIPMLNPDDLDLINTDVQATLKTNQGDIVLLLHGQAAPIAVGNFVKLANENFYDGTTFHRAIPDFMIQGGDPLSKDPTQRALHGTGGPDYKFQDEVNDRPMVRGSIAMANAGPNTNGSQFFIVTGAEFPHLQGKHTNFGEVTEGMEIVDAISQVERDGNDNPLTPVVIEDIVIERL